MDCKEFRHWLTSRDIHEALLPGEAAGHMAECRECERLFHVDGRLEDAIRAGMRMEAPPKGMAEKISATLDHQEALRPSGVIKIALACLILVLVTVFFPFSEKSGSKFKDLNQVSLQAVQGHIAGNRHMNFQAEEVDQALELLTRELGFQVLLPDLEPFGCTLLGGRLCVLGDCRAAYFVLDRDGRSGSLYIMDTRFLSFDMADGSRFNTRIKGCEANVWKENGQIYAMVF